MKGNESALYSHYIIDGIRHETSPAELLDECMEYSGNVMLPDEADTFDDIIDESTDPPVSPYYHDSSQNEEHARKIAASTEERPFTMLYPEQFTRLQIASALTSRLWSEGHFRLGDLRIWAQWEWNTRPIGNMAAFYSSTAAASDYIYSLGVRMKDYLFIENDETCSAKFFAWLPEEEEDDCDCKEDNGLFKTSPYESRHPWIGDGRKCASKMIPDESSWLIYIPFDTCPYKLGGSLLAQKEGKNGGPGTQLQDPDYFIDCYEVVRELVEDGIIIAGVCVGDGGLATAAKRMSGKYAVELDLSGLISSYQETDMTKILFGETPGVLMQIRDNDYDYLDSQLLLQDVAYYPLAHPGKAEGGLTFKGNSKSTVSGILASLLDQASEGED